MSRKKPKVVGTVTHHDTGIKVEIKMFPDTLSFIAELPDGTQLQNSDGKQIRNDVWTWLSSNLSLTWQDVIEVEKLAPFANTDKSFIGFNLERFHVAKKTMVAADAHYKYVMADWGCKPGDPTGSFHKELYGWERVNQFRFDGDFILPAYTNRNAIVELKDGLHTMLSDPAGIAKIAMIGSTALKALPAVTEEVK